MLSFTNAHGERLDHTLHGPLTDPDVPCVVIGHGVTANKDRAFLVALAEGLAAAGITALRFSFAGNGESQGRFEDATVSKETGDLTSVLDALGDRPLAYVGHSMGAAVGVLVAARDPRIRWLVSLAGMADTRTFAWRKFGAQEPGSLMWDKPDCPLSQAFMDDMAAIDTVFAQASAIAVPWLLVHGPDDSVVPLVDAQACVARAPDAALVEVPGADHVFADEATPPMVRCVVGWLRERLSA